jgi:hypothetical protein
VPSHCLASDNKAIIAVYGENGQEIERIEIQKPPIDVSVQNIIDSVIYSHSMTARIDKTFNDPVTGVEILSTGPQWNIGPGYPLNSCPMPSISGNRIFAEFDSYPGGVVPTGQSPDPYANNTGTCVYRVSFGSNESKLKASSTQGEVNRVYSQKITYKVSCNGKCLPGEIECPKPGYPGYCCISCQGTASKISNLRSKIRG